MHKHFACAAMYVCLITEALGLVSAAWHEVFGQFWGCWNRTMLVDNQELAAVVYGCENIGNVRCCSGACETSAGWVGSASTCMVSSCLGKM